MAAFLGQVCGCREATSRLGTKSSGIHTSAQSYDGSCQVDLNYNEDKILQIRLSVSDDSSYYGNTMFRGSFEEFKNALTLLNDIKSGRVSIVRHRLKK